MSTSEIIPCPFCGDIPELALRVYDTASSKTYGFHCCIEMETGTTDRDAALAMWNTRKGLLVLGRECDLPPVGAGNILTELLASNGHSPTKLGKIIRQSVVVSKADAPFGYVINEFGDSTPAVSAQEAAGGVRIPAPLGASEDEFDLSRAPLDEADRVEGDMFKVADHDLHELLNLSADLAMGYANQDTGMMWLDYLNRIQARLAPAVTAQPGQDDASSDMSDSERIVHTLSSQPTAEAQAFYDSMSPGTAAASSTEQVHVSPSQKDDDVRPLTENERQWMDQMRQIVAAKFPTLHFPVKDHNFHDYWSHYFKEGYGPETAFTAERALGHWG